MDKKRMKNRYINEEEAYCDGINCIIKERLDYVLDLAEVGLWEWEVATDRLTFSDELKSMIGLKATGNTFTMDYLVKNVIHSDSRNNFIRAIEEAKINGHITDGTYAVELDGNPILWVKVKGIIYKDQEGKSVKIKGIVKNVTESHNMNLKLDGELNYIETILEAIPNPLFYKNSEGKYRFFNQAFLEYLGLTYDDLYDKTVYEIAPQALAEVYDKADKALMASKGKQVYEAEVKYADGSLRLVEFVKATHIDGEGEVLGLIGLMQDISKRKQEESRMVMVDQMKESIVQLNNNIIKYKDEEEFLHDVLRVLQELFGKSQQSSILEINKEGLVHVKTSLGYDTEYIKNFEIKVEETFIYKESKGQLDCACIINDLSRFFSMNIKHQSVTESHSIIRSSLEIPIVIEDKVKYIFSMDSCENKVFDDNDLFVGNYIRTQFQVLYRVFSLYQSTLYMSRYDVMSGVMNRRYLDEQLEKAMKEADASGHYFSIVLFDLDGLKKVNDAYGHAVGDQYITLFSAYLKDNFGGEANVGRIGGDEFISIVQGLSSDKVVQKVEQMRKVFMNEDIHTDEGVIHGSFSYGVEKYDDSKYSLKQLIKSADAKMYFYKQRNKKLNGD